MKAEFHIDRGKRSRPPGRLGAGHPGRRWGAVLALLLVSLALAAQSQVTFTEYPGPTTPTFQSGGSMVDITTGPDGNLWFTENYAFGAPTSIGRITPSGVTTYFPVPSGDSEGQITTGSDGNLWFTEYRTGKIGRITPSGAITEFSGSSFAYGITAGPDGNLWFTEGAGSGRVGIITTAGVILTRFEMPGGGDASDITTGPDGNLWITRHTRNSISRITPAQVTTEFPLPTSNSYPTSIASGADGNLWFVENAGNKIGRITPAGVITEFPVPTSGSFPFCITRGPDGNMWYSTEVGNQVGSVTPGGVITEFPIPTPSRCLGITGGPDGNVWLLESTANKIVKIQLPTTTIAISNVDAAADVRSATVTWKTNVPGTTVVEWGKTTAYGNIASSSVLMTDHLLWIPVTRNTLYHYRVSSTDALGNVATSGDFTFTTLRQALLTRGGDGVFDYAVRRAANGAYNMEVDYRYRKMGRFQVSLNNVTVVDATLGGANSAGLPILLGTMLPGDRQTFRLSFPASAGPPGATVPLAFHLDYTTSLGNHVPISGNFSVQLP